MVGSLCPLHTRSLELVAVKWPALAKSLKCTIEQAKRAIAGYDQNGIPVAWEPSRGADQRPRPMWIRTRLTRDVADVAAKATVILNQQPLLHGHSPTLCQQRNYLSTDGRVFGRHGARGGPQRRSISLSIVGSWTAPSAMMVNS
jgi:hypothetical protein